MILQVQNLVWDSQDVGACTDNLKEIQYQHITPPNLNSTKFGITILQCNITSLNKEILKWLLGLQAHVVLIQEHHLRDPKATYYKNKLKKRYHVIFNSAVVQQSGTSGGVAILVLKGLHVTCPTRGNPPKTWWTWRVH